MIRVFTSAAPNYLGKVAALFSSLRRLHPEFALHLVLADREPPAAGAQLFGAEVIVPEQLGATPAWLFQHHLVELATALKGPALLALLERPETDGVLYFDPDIVLFSRLDDVVDELASASIVVTPHLLEPETAADAVADNEMCALQHGAFNLGFLGVQRCREGLRFAAWWAERLRAHCQDRRDVGLFTDQKWMDLAPGFFPGLRILRDSRLNVAPWNIGRRHVAGSFDQGFTVDGKPLGFYHFTGFDSGAHHAVLGKYAPGNRALAMLVDWYRLRERALAPSETATWSLATYRDGTPITSAERSIYREQKGWLEEAFPDPYASGPDSFQAWWRWQHPVVEEPASDGGAAGERPAAPRPGAAAARPVRVDVPPNLHVAHSWGGGIERWVGLFAAHDPRRNLVLTSEGTPAAYGLQLVLRDATDGEQLDRWVLAEPIAELVDHHAEYRRVIEEVVGQHRVGHTYVSSLIGHALEVLDPGTPVTLVHHDFFPFCPALNLTFGSTCVTCQPGQLHACLTENRHSHLFRQNSAASWLRLRARYLAAVGDAEVQHVFPSLSARDALCTVEPGFADLRLDVVEHGIEGKGPDCFGGAPDGRRLRLLVLGRITPFKGATGLGVLLPLLRREMDIAIVGCGWGGAELATLANLAYFKDYAIAELDGLLGELRPDLALFASEVPETFCFTVAEVQARGIPPVARGVGAISERIREGETGLLFASDADCLALLDSVGRQRHRLRRIAANLRRAPVRTAHEMVADYYALRGEHPVPAAALARGGGSVRPA